MVHNPGRIFLKPMQKMAFHSGQNEMTIPFRPKWKDHSGQNGEYKKEYHSGYLHVYILSAFQIPLCCCLILTLIAEISDTFMFRFLVFLKSLPSSSFHPLFFSLLCLLLLTHFRDTQEAEFFSAIIF